MGMAAHSRAPRPVPLSRRRVRVLPGQMELPWPDVRRRSLRLVPPPPRYPAVPECTYLGPRGHVGQCREYHCRYSLVLEQLTHPARLPGLSHDDHLAARRLTKGLRWLDDGPARWLDLWPPGERAELFRELAVAGLPTCSLDTIEAGLERTSEWVANLRNESRETVRTSVEMLLESLRESVLRDHEM